MTHKRDLLSVALACGLGAFVGSLIALEVATRMGRGWYFGIIGALIGGALSYVVIDFRAWPVAIRRGYHKVTAWRPPSRLYWRALFAQWLKMWALCATTIAMMLVFFVAVARPVDPTLGLVISIEMLTFLSVTSIWVWSFLSLTLGLVMALGFVGVRSSEEDVTTHNARLIRVREDGYVGAKTLNPIYIAFWLALRTPKTLSRASMFVLMALLLLGRFVSAVFVYVHSDRRTICFVGGALGAMVGYGLGSAIVGAVAGVVAGSVSYQFVSVRWLKLNPV
ncbi:MAG: hypothetical protein KBD24_02510 [Candidatus Pacebacteria bacterium]|nr:hypothetical protein [Candidatus Paceibacterota bacterium]